MKRHLAALSAAMALLGFGGPSSAHHSFAMFDQEHPMQLVGTVKEFRYTSPHSFIILEVKDSGGGTRLLRSLHGRDPRIR